VQIPAGNEKKLIPVCQTVEEEADSNIHSNPGANSSSILVLQFFTVPVLNHFSISVNIYITILHPCIL